VEEDDRSRFGLLALGQPGVGADGDEAEAGDGLDGFAVRDQAGEAEEDRGGHAPLDEGLFQLQDVGAQVLLGGEDEVFSQGLAGVVVVGGGVVPR